MAPFEPLPDFEFNQVLTARSFGPLPDHEPTKASSVVLTDHNHFRVRIRGLRGWDQQPIIGLEQGLRWGIHCCGMHCALNDSCQWPKTWFLSLGSPLSFSFLQSPSVSSWAGKLQHQVTSPLCFSCGNQLQVERLVPLSRYGNPGSFKRWKGKYNKNLKEGRPQEGNTLAYQGRTANVMGWRSLDLLLGGGMSQPCL